ncbi:MAG: GNAT family N-acetyltransferase [Rubrivivax sp.]
MPAPWLGDASSAAGLEAWSLRRVARAEGPEFEQLVTFMVANPAYRLQTQGRVHQRRDAVDLAQDLPAGATPAQKYLWTLWHDERVVGCLEVLRGWPQAHTVYIGFLMTDERQRHRGHARAALRLLAQRSRSWSGVRRWRLAVVDSQEDALRFWRRAGFAPTGEQLVSDSYRRPLVVMERAALR